MNCLTPSKDSKLPLTETESADEMKCSISYFNHNDTSACSDSPLKYGALESQNHNTIYTTIAPPQQPGVQYMSFTVGSVLQSGRGRSHVELRG